MNRPRHPRPHSTPERRLRPHAPRPGPGRGLNAAHFQSDELAELQSLTVQALNGEIQLARMAEHRLLELLDEAKTRAEKVALLNALTTTTMRVASLLRTRQALTGDSDTVADMLVQALGEMELEEKEKE